LPFELQPAESFERINQVIAKILMIASAAIVLAIGIIHLVYTFHGPKLTPRDPALQQKMQQVSPVLTRETIIWKAWMGVNATHSLALILFGLIYSYLAWSNSQFLFGSPFLLVTGLGMLLALVVLAKTYFFSNPFRAVCLSLFFYIGYWKHHSLASGAAIKRRRDASCSVVEVRAIRSAMLQWDPCATRVWPESCR
jgi:hypothetical protein